jgi:hypothetical protein
MLAHKIGESEGQMVGVRVLETSAAAAQNDTEITTSSTKEPSGNRQYGRPAPSAQVAHMCRYGRQSGVRTSPCG